MCLQLRFPSRKSNAQVWCYTVSPKSCQIPVQMNRWIKSTHYLPYLLAHYHKQTRTFQSLLSSKVVSFSNENSPFYLIKGVLHEKIDRKSTRLNSSHPSIS